MTEQITHVQLVKQRLAQAYGGHAIALEYAARRTIIHVTFEHAMGTTPYCNRISSYDADNAIDFDDFDDFGAVELDERFCIPCLKSMLKRATS